MHLGEVFHCTDQSHRVFCIVSVTIHEQTSTHTRTHTHARARAHTRARTPRSTLLRAIEARGSAGAERAAGTAPTFLTDAGRHLHCAALPGQTGPRRTAQSRGLGNERKACARVVQRGTEEGAGTALGLQALACQWASAKAPVSIAQRLVRAFVRASERASVG